MLSRAEQAEYNKEVPEAFTIMLKRPGAETDPPQEIIDELRHKFNKDKRDMDLKFFGGQPVSLSRTHLSNRVFKIETDNRTNEVKPNDYLICEKTDGVRFLLIITSFEDSNYLMSRLEGKGNKPVFYQADALKIAKNYDAIDNTQGEQPKFQNIIEILDGELCIDQYPDGSGSHQYKMKYLVFDILVHHKTLITRRDLSERLAFAEQFVRGNNFGLEYKPNRYAGPISVDIQIKDFFEITKPNKDKPDAKSIEFLFNQYIPSLPHENDGIIFNDKTKQYLLGTNDGYLKWKPSFMNSVDFLGVPNTKIDDQYHPYRIIDLYSRSHDQQTDTYSQLFEAFMVVEQSFFHEVDDKRNQKTESTGEYVRGLVLECNYIAQKKQVQNVYISLYKKSQDYFQDKIMIQRTDTLQRQKTKKLKNVIFSEFWTHMRIRDDRSAGNNSKVVENIMSTIKQNITQQDLMKESNKYFEHIKDFRNRSYGIRN